MKSKGYITYNYCEDNTLITRTEQIKDYFDYKFKHLEIDIDDKIITETIQESIDNAIGQDFQNNIEETIKDTLTTTLNDVDCKLETISDNVELIKTDITEKLDDIATKEDINIVIENIEEKVDTVVEKIESVVETINEHTTQKFNEIDFNKKFSDLNEQIKSLTETLPTISNQDEDIVNVLANMTNIDPQKLLDGVASDIDYEKLAISGGTY